MAGLGNPLSFGLGGERSPQELAYIAMRDAVGVGNSAPGEPLDSIIEAWRMARARGLAASIDDDRAAIQIDPEFATDFIPVYENLLGRFFPLATDDQARRDELTTEYVRSLQAAFAPLQARLQLLNPGAVFEFLPRAQTRDTQFGRVFEDHDPLSVAASGPEMLVDPPNSGPKVSSFPNFSSDFIVRVLSPPLIFLNFTEDDRRVIRQMITLLNEVLPSWIDFRIYISCGFILDIDLLDVTVFCS